MQQWKLTLAYDGTPFHGWQVQPGLATVQGTLAAALYRITGETILPQGSGRTDAGVHALAQVASFNLASPIPPANLLRALNRALPPSIRILAATYASHQFHARHAALSKTYEYRIFPSASAQGIASSAPVKDSPFTLSSSSAAASHHACSPFLAQYVWDCRLPLCLALAAQAAVHTLGTHDFTSFAAADPDLTARSGPMSPPNNVRTIYRSTWVREGDLLVYRVTGSGFLHHMVRNLVGTFVEVAAGRTPPDALPGILAARRRSAAGPTAPARGLFLVSVDYAGTTLDQPAAPLPSEMREESSHSPVVDS